MEQIFNKYKHYLLTIILIIFFTILAYKHLTSTYIVIEFKDLRPVHERLNVYYKGFKVGKTEKIFPSKDYNSTFIKVILYPKNLNLPRNTTAILKREKKHKFREKVDFIELIPPKNPLLERLLNKDIISGTYTIDIESYLSSQDPDSLDEIKNNLNTATKNLNTAINSLNNLLLILQQTIKENQASINNATTNFAKTSKNINQITDKFNNSINQEQLDNTTSNFGITSTNILQTTQNIENLSTNLNSSMPQIVSSIEQINGITKNLNEITCGLSKTLQKRGGGLRILFGVCIDDSCKYNCK